MPTLPKGALIDYGTCYRAGGPAGRWAGGPVGRWAGGLG
jgi:hypothetical protein